MRPRRALVSVLILITLLAGPLPSRAKDSSPAVVSKEGGGSAGFRAIAARTGFVDEPGPKGPPAIIWRAEARFAQTMSAANGALGVHTDRGVSLFDAETGEVRWHAEQEPSGAAPVIAGDAVCVGSANGFRAYDLATREMRWEYLNGMEGSPDTSMTPRRRTSTGPSTWALALTRIPVSPPWTPKPER